MPAISFGKRQRFADISANALPKGGVPAFDLRRFPRRFADAPMRFLGKNIRVGVPEIAETDAPSVRRGYPTPQPSTGAGTPVTDHEGDDLAGPATHDHPEPPFPCPFPHTRPDFIEFRHILWGRRGQRRLQRWQRPDFFLIRSDSVLRDTPKTRPIPPHTRTFVIGCEDLFAAFRAVSWWLRCQDADRATVFAEILLTSAPMMPVFDNVETATFAAAMGMTCRDHVVGFMDSAASVKNIFHHLRVSHYQIYHCLCKAERIG